MTEGVPCFKIAYITHDEAKKSMKDLNARNGELNRSKKPRNQYKFKKHQRIYKCPNCGFYHLTSKVRGKSVKV